MSLLWKFKSDASGVLEGLNDAEANVFLNQELGINLQSKQDTSLVKAMQKPDEYITARNTALTTAVTNIHPQFVKYQKSLIAAGIPTNRAKDYALSYAENLLNAELNVWNLTNPGYEQTFAFARRNDAIRNEVSNNMIAETSQLTGVSKEEKRAIKQKALAKYKAQKRETWAGKNSNPHNTTHAITQ